MRANKFLYLLVSACILVTKAQSQGIQFDSTGKLLVIQLKNSYPGKFSPYQFYKKTDAVNFLFKENDDTTALIKGIMDSLERADNNLKAAYRKILIKKIETTLDIIDDPDKNLKTILDSLWDVGTREKYVTDLKNLKQSLESGTIATFSPTYLGKTKEILKANLMLDDTLASSYSIQSLSKNSLTLWKTDLYKRFKFQYYNTTYRAAPGSITNLRLPEIPINTNQSDVYRKKADSLIRLVYNNNYEITWEYFELMNDFIKTLDKKSAGFRLERMPASFTDIITMFQQSWFKEWLWFNNGITTINPLNITTEEFLSEKLTYDADKATLSNTYVDSMLARHLRMDTVANVERYDKLISQKNKGKERFSIADEIKANSNEMESLVTYSKLLNKVLIPKKGMFYNSAIGDTVSSKINLEKYLTFPLSNPGKKIIALHNIPGGYTAKLQEDNKLIPRRSDFMNFIDSVGSVLAELADSYNQITAYAPLLPTVKAASGIGNKVITAKTTTMNIARIDEELLPSFSYDTILYRKLDENKRYDAITFSRTIKKIEKDSSDTRIFTKERPLSEMQTKDSVRHQKFFKQFFVEYEKILSFRMQEVFQEVRKDSLLLSFTGKVFKGATLLPKPLESKEDKNPVFYSAILSTSASDSSIEKKVTPYAYNKDTVTAASFTYKTDKGLHFQLGAGIAYTITNFIQTKASEENGQIKIENTSQAYRFIVGIHYQFGKGLFVHDNRFGGRFNERSSIYLGVGIPKPLENVYLGYGYDLVPGLKLTTGFHFYRNDTYTILNNSIVDKRQKYNVAFPFFAIQIDPSSLLKILSITKK